MKHYLLTLKCLYNTGKVKYTYKIISGSIITYILNLQTNAYLIDIMIVNSEQITLAEYLTYENTTSTAKRPC